MKVWYQSATFWALVVSATAHALVLIGVPESDAQQVAAELVRAAVPVVGLIADAVGVWGRARAAGPLSAKHDDRRIE
jgi:hypothetical protein